MVGRWVPAWCVSIVVCAFAVLQLMPAGLCAPRLDGGDWPKYMRDSHNSGRSPATVLATPVIKWAVSLNDVAYTAGQPSLCEPVIDSAGNVYVVDQGATGKVTKVSSRGSVLWRSSLNLGPAYFGTCALWNAGAKSYVLTGVGWGSGKPSTTNPIGVSFVVPATGATDSFAATTPNGSDLSPAVAPDGTIYAAYQTGVYAGRLVAIEPETKTIKWMYGDASRGEFTIGSVCGSPVVITISDGGVAKNIIVHGGRTGKTIAATKDDLIAVVDDGDRPRLLWHATIGLHSFSAALSNDGKTVYCLNTTAGAGSAGNLIALGTLTGRPKWQFSTHDTHSRNLAIGADGTIYIGSNTGKLYAVIDSGTSARLKWSVALPDGGLCSTPAVISSSPAVVYLGTSNGWFYAIRDNGSSGSILWRKWRFVPSGFAIPGPASIAKDGTVYCQYGDSLVAFQPGFTTQDAFTTTIKGKVLDINGSPIDAYVGLSSQTMDGLPLARNRFGYVRTDAHGSYEIQLQGAEPGHYYVAAWGHDFSESAPKSYFASDPAAITIRADTPTLTQDFVLKEAGQNAASRVSGAKVTCNNEAPANPGEDAIDGDPTSRWMTVDRAGRYPTAEKPVLLTIDLGKDTAISQAVLYWEYSCAGAYKIQCLPGTLAPDVEANWTEHSTTVYSSSYGAPVHCYPETFGGGAWADVLKFSATSSRYWRLRITSGFPGRSALVSLWDLELDAVPSP